MGQDAMQPQPQPAAAPYAGYPAQGVPQQPPVPYAVQMHPPPPVQVTHVINGVPITPGPGQSVMIEEETYCGPITWLIGIFLLPCICFCPVDRRQRVITTTQNTTTVQYTA